MAFDVNFLASYDVDSIAAEVRRIATVTGKNTVSTNDIIRHGRVNVTTVFLKFGSIASVNEAAGLAFTPVKKWTNHEILRTLIDLWNRTLRECGRRPVKRDIKRFGLPFSSEVVCHRFGTWRKALIAANDLANSNVHEPPPVTSRRRSTVSVRRRFQVFKRDNYECRICHRTEVPLELDHKIPVCQGGNNQPNNLQTLCWDCNRGKGGSLQ